jgi:hypothetical protein
MTEQEARDLARRIAEDSEIFDFDLALELVHYRPAEAEKIIRDREEMREMMDNLTRANQRLHRAALEFR